MIKIYLSLAVCKLFLPMKIPARVNKYFTKTMKMHHMILQKLIIRKMSGDNTRNENEARQTKFG